MFDGRGAIGYDHGYDAEAFYMGLALDPNYIEGFVEGCLERTGENYPEDEAMFRAFAHMPHPPSQVFYTWANRRLDDAEVVRQITKLRSEEEYDQGLTYYSFAIRLAGSN